ncbi:MAG: diguanylate cyclase [Lachnospiraceae bacterium]|nr:diguanylate cyclase [Lachnospiraceae bacterium]
MSKVKGKPIANFLYILVSLCAIGFLMYAYFRPHLNTKLQMEPVLELKDDWIYVSPEGETKYLREDEFKPNQKNGLIISHVLPKREKVPYDTLALWSVFQTVEIEIDGKVIYSNEDSTMKARGLERNQGSIWNFVHLPYESAGKIMTIRTKSPYRDFQGHLGRCMLGTYSGVYSRVKHDYAVRVLVSLVFILIGVIFFIFHLVQARKSLLLSSGTISSLFAFWLGLWTFTESHGASFYIGNAPFISILSFVAVRMAVISFLLYFRSVFARDFRKWNGALLVVLCLELGSSTLLQILQIRDYYESVGAYVALLAVMLCSVFFEIVYSLAKKKYQEYKMLLIATLVLSLLVGLDSVLLGSGQKWHIPYGVSTSLGMLLLIVVFTVNEFTKARKQAILAARAEHFQQLAQTDALTGVNNRMTENRWLEAHRVMTPEEKMNTCVIVCDMNCLKIVNDTYGHQSGDEAIRITARLLKECFGVNGVVCRTGGDEFTVFTDNMNAAQVEGCIQQVRQRVEIENRNTDYLLSVSAGYAFFDPQQDIALENTISRADDAMYHDKMLIKNVIWKR